jgi:hypothetical protein
MPTKKKPAKKKSRLVRKFERFYSAGEALAKELGRVSARKSDRTARILERAIVSGLKFIDTKLEKAMAELDKKVDKSSESKKSKPKTGCKSCKKVCRKSGK